MPIGFTLFGGGEGVPKNTSEGIRLLKTAAAQNHQWARDYLKKRGNGEIDNFSITPKNTLREIQSDYSRTNDRDIINNARKLYTGVGVEQNYAKAFELFYPLAQGGNPEAARFVGLMYLSGKGKSKDLKLAKQWLSVAAQKGDKPSIKLLDSYRSLFK